VLIDVAAERIDSKLDGNAIVVSEVGASWPRADGLGADPVSIYGPADGSSRQIARRRVWRGDNYFYRLTAAHRRLSIHLSASGAAGSRIIHALWAAICRRACGGGLRIGGMPLEKLPVRYVPATTLPGPALALAGFSRYDGLADGIDFRLPPPMAQRIRSIYFSKTPTVCRGGGATTSRSPRKKSRFRANSSDSSIAA